MRNGFEREVARFGATDIEFIADLLRSVYGTLNTLDDRDNDGMDSESKLLFGDFIEALDDCDCIEIVSDEEMLVDEG